MTNILPMPRGGTSLTDPCIGVPRSYDTASSWDTPPPGSVEEDPFHLKVRIEANSSCFGGKGLGVPRSISACSKGPQK